MTRLKPETLAHSDHIAQLPCILSTQEIANRIGIGKYFGSVIVVQPATTTIHVGTAVLGCPAAQVYRAAAAATTTTVGAPCLAFFCETWESTPVTYWGFRGARHGLSRALSVREDKGFSP
ncbi:MAG: hypothetical protein WBW31_24265 [Candidatus Sulfotelmatobacter sp.]